MAKLVGVSPKHEISVYRVNSDSYGNPRYVVHYLAAPMREFVPEPGLTHLEQIRAEQIVHIEHAKRVFYGHKYRGRNFGGGIVFSTYEDVLSYVDRCVDEAV